MRIGLVSAPMRDNDLLHQLSVMADCLTRAKAFDLIVFGESFLQGFEGLTWQYEEDLKRAVAIGGPEIEAIRRMARQAGCAISFGFIERAGALLYSSNIVLDAHGQTVDLYRRVSNGWKEPVAGPQYCEGDGFHTFTLGGVRFAVAICGDLWDAAHVTALSAMAFDVLLWPLYVDFSPDYWKMEGLQDYVRQAALVNRPCLMVNSHEEEPERAKGGCYVFDRGTIQAALPMGKTGLLVWETPAIN